MTIPIEQALCCGLTCGQTYPGGTCAAHTHGAAQLTRLRAAGFGTYRRDPPNPLPRCGDHVFHIPSGEQWVVAWAEGDDIAWSGWPNGMARCGDVRIIHRATDEQHRQAVTEWLSNAGRDDSRQVRIRRLYGKALETPDHG